ncbi:hypothetical protein COZ26_00545 [Candidatus Kuenenbacteria bacterium CG_4_10_14_3_um_filter_39_14]|uniref:Uncharacterized protein n=3 Tax=Candidatus Kueneniibacteriota TaxID=1752740 RepID=A0A2M7MHW9_9BACT|nr:MAG: hypothetical protein COZ26_00545 [Candidatus Kuenenbacteria bacterium CG_4_10_14_3_um_filter_39_14]
MLMKKIFLISIIFILSMSLVLPVLAQTTQQPSPSADTAEGIINKQLNDLEAIGLPAEPANPVDPIINLVKMCLSVLAVVFLILIIYAGFRWMLSGGNSETIEKAKKIMIAAAVGLLIIFLSYSVTLFVFNVVLSGGRRF